MALNWDVFKAPTARQVNILNISQNTSDCVLSNMRWMSFRTDPGLCFYIKWLTCPSPCPFPCRSATIILPYPPSSIESTRFRTLDLQVIHRWYTANDASAVAAAQFQPNKLQQKPAEFAQHNFSDEATREYMRTLSEPILLEWAFWDIHDASATEVRANIIDYMYPTPPAPERTWRERSVQRMRRWFS